jgi:amino acid adenylation domain-containing protein
MQINVLEYFERRCAERETAERVAIVDGNRSFTFGELEKRAKACAAMLARRAPDTGAPIAVYLPKSAEVVLADIAIMYAGDIYSNLDVKSPVPRVLAILNNIRPDLVITDRTRAATLVAAGVEERRLFFIEDCMGEVADLEPCERYRRLIDTDPLCIINTSGSTGIPKGVVLNHRSTIDFMDWVFDRLNLAEGERIGSVSPFYFDLYTFELFLCLAKGATIVITPESYALFPARLVEFLRQQEISLIFWVPSIMVNMSNQGLMTEGCCPSLRTVMFAGEVFPTKHFNRWRRALPQASFINLYGPIEITVDCTYYIVDRDFADDEPLPIGLACRNTGILILNEDNLECSDFERGELCVRGSSLAMGYWNDPEKTARAFVQNPLNDRYPEIIYRTGDLGYRNQRGEIMFVGRKDFQIKHMGYRIELQEIEQRVLAIPEVAYACVVYNQPVKEITLFYQTKDGRELGPGFVRGRLSESLPPYMLPKAFRHMAELPRNPNGKIDRTGLSSMLAAELSGLAR